MYRTKNILTGATLILHIVKLIPKLMNFLPTLHCTYYHWRADSYIANVKYLNWQMLTHFIVEEEDTASMRPKSKTVYLSHVYKMSMHLFKSSAVNNWRIYSLSK